MHDDDDNTFETPSDKYRIACCKTIYTYRVLKDKNPDREVSLKIYNAVTKTLDETFDY